MPRVRTHKCPACDEIRMFDVPRCETCGGELVEVHVSLEEAGRIVRAWQATVSPKPGRPISATPAW